MSFFFITSTCFVVPTLLIATFGINAQDAPVRSKFSCEGRVSGYYADVDTGCQVYHMCDGLGRQFSYSCPNTTLFQQRMLICDHWYMVNCSKSEVDYSANLLIGQREKPFVDDSDQKHSFQRTPRPDLLSHPSEAEFNIIYRNGRAQFKNNLNLVGAESDDDDKSRLSTEATVYFLPSHWSTRYSKTTTSSPTERKPTTRIPLNENRRQNTKLRNNYNSASNVIPQIENTTQFPVYFKSSYRGTTPVYPKYVNLSETQLKEDNVGLLPPSNPNTNEQPVTKIPVNFKSSYKGTTPVYPKYVNLSEDRLKEDDVGLVPPVEASERSDANVEDVTEVPVNFKSNFKGTTPVYPKFVNLSKWQLKEDDVGLQPPISGAQNDNATEVPVNFKSEFKATTPVYPKYVNLSEDRLKEDDVGLVPPPGNNKTEENVEFPSLNLDFLPPEPDSSHLTRNDTESDVVQPSKFYQPPFFHPDYTTQEKQPKRNTNGDFSASSSTLSPLIVNPSQNGEKQWKDLRNLFLIPDYEFPLDSISRPSYESDVSSFQARQTGSSRKKK